MTWAILSALVNGAGVLRGGGTDFPGANRQKATTVYAKEGRGRDRPRERPPARIPACEEYAAVIAVAARLDRRILAAVAQVVP